MAPRSSARENRLCVRCVMDKSDPDIRFDAEGVCNHCRAAEPLLRNVLLTAEESASRLASLSAQIAAGRTAAGYDSIIGLSGGVDSSYTAWLAHKLGLRPLAVHLDNGWNSEIAVANIHNLVQRCGLDLVTLVIDWQEFRDLQRAFIKAGVVDIEMLSDHAIVASMFQLCKKHGIRSVLSGTNVATEHGMPRSWVWNKQDLTNIRAIHARFGSISLKTYPTMGLLRSMLWWMPVVGCRFVELLDHANYRRGAAVEELKREVGWRDYGGKHHESIFTKFYQCYILPAKFGIDKRRVHLSALIRNREIDRDAAFNALKTPIYDASELRRDKEFVLKKLAFSETELDQIMAAPPVPHDRYRSDRWLRDAARPIIRLFS